MTRPSEFLKHAWNAFVIQEEKDKRPFYADTGSSYGTRPDRPRMYLSSERSIISSIYTRLSIDIAQVELRHVRLDDKDRYTDDINSGLNQCLTVEPNLDQAPRAFRQDLISMLFDKGVAVIVPVETSLNPEVSGGYDIQNMRVGEVVTWYPKHVRVRVYNEISGRQEEITIEKKIAPIIENPLYSVMNEQNSTLQRLIRKLNMLDAVDEQSSSGKLDMIVQLPYVIKSEAKREAAMQRRTDIEEQLKNGKYGIAYIDGTEKITQLNRPAENNLMAQVEYLTALLYNQLGLTEAIMNGTADEQSMLNYNNRTVEPIVNAIVQEMHRKFLTKTARSQKQAVRSFRDPFAYTTLKDLVEMADKFTRNEIATSNEIRQVVGWKPSTEAKADKLVNSNMPQPGDSPPTPKTSEKAEAPTPPTNDSAN